MRKKAIPILLILLVLLSAVPAYGAGPTAAASLSRETAKPGQKVSVTVTLENNPGLAAWMFTLSWDAQTLSLADSRAPLRAGAPFSSGTMLANTAGGGELTVNWFTLADNGQSGELFTAEFVVKDGAVNGDHPITLTCSGENTINVEEEPVPVQTVDAVLTVTGGADAEAEPPRGSAPQNGAPAVVSPATPAAESGSPGTQEDTTLVITEETVTPGQAWAGEEDTEETSDNVPGEETGALRNRWLFPAAVLAAAAVILYVTVFRKKGKVKKVEDKRGTQA